MRIGLLIPYSGEFPGLKRALLNPFQSHVKETGGELIVEYIDKGEAKVVAKAIEKLFYSDDVDVIVGYVGYRVIAGHFDKIRKYSDKFFIHISLGEVIPYTNEFIHYPPNYCLISAEAWKTIAYLGKWVATELPANDCLICTSNYDAGYSLTEAFRIGYHGETEKTLRTSILRDQRSYDVSGLFADIDTYNPEHIHVSLTGRELNGFIERFASEVNYRPSVSFAFPLPLIKNRSQHPSLEKAYTAMLDACIPADIATLQIDPFTAILGYLSDSIIHMLEEKGYGFPQEIRILRMDLLKGELALPFESGTVPASYNGAFNYSAEQSISIWQNPYLCV